MKTISLMVCDKCKHKTRRTTFEFDTPVAPDKRFKTATGKLRSEIWGCATCGDFGFKLYNEEPAESAPQRSVLESKVKSLAK